MKKSAQETIEYMYKRMYGDKAKLPGIQKPEKKDK